LWTIGLDAVVCGGVQIGVGWVLGPASGYESVVVTFTHLIEAVARLIGCKANKQRGEDRYGDQVGPVDGEVAGGGAGG